MRFTKAQIQAKGNPHDVPFDRIVRELKANRGNRCEQPLCEADYMITGQRKTRATAAADVDSYDNLKLVCQHHTTNAAPEYTRIVAATGRKRK